LCSTTIVARGCEGAPVSHLHHRAKSSGRGSPTALGKPAAVFLRDAQELARSRDRLTKGLESIGFPVLKSQGTYFLTVDLSPLGLNETDEAFCKRIVTDYKVAAIPVCGILRRGCRDLGGAVLFRQERRDAGHRAGAAVGCGASQVGGVL